MKILHVALLVGFVVLSATTAQAQFGLYGSPEMLNLQEATATPAAYTSYAAPSLASAAAVPKPPAPPVPAGGTQPARPSVVDQMLSESCEPEDCGCADCGCGMTYGAFGGVTGWFERAIAGGCPAQPVWYASVSTLVLSRDKANQLWTTCDAGDETNKLSGTQDMNMACGWGGEIRFGRRFCGCGHRALEAVYWTTEPFNGRLMTRNGAAQVDSPLNFNDIFFGGAAANLWFNGADEHLLQRRNEFHNVEINMVHYPVFCEGNGYWDFSWLAGIRYFRFEEELLFGSVRAGGTWSHGADQAYLTDQIENNLIGFQLGCDAGYRVAPKWRLFAAPRFGVYNNHIRNFFELHLEDATCATQTAYPGEVYPVSSHKDVLSFLGQIDLGMSYQFSRNWSAKVGYRVVAITGVGLADNQIPNRVADIPTIRNIDTNADLILHGAFVGVEYNF